MLTQKRKDEIAAAVRQWRKLGPANLDRPRAMLIDVWDEMQEWRDRAFTGTAETRPFRSGTTRLDEGEAAGSDPLRGSNRPGQPHQEEATDAN